MRDKTCNICKSKGYVANIFKKASGGAAAGVASSVSGLAKRLVPAIKPKLSFAKRTKKDGAKDGFKGIVLDEILSVFASVPLGQVEWLGDSRASRQLRAMTSVCRGM